MQRLVPKYAYIECNKWGVANPEYCLLLLVMDFKLHIAMYAYGSCIKICTFLRQEDRYVLHWICAYFTVSLIEI